MLANDLPITKFKALLLHNLGLHERHRPKTDSFDSEEIDQLYKAFKIYEGSETKEHLHSLSSALHQCEDIKKELPYKELYDLIEQMQTSFKRPTPK